MSQTRSARYTARNVMWRHVAMLLIVAVITHQFVMMVPQLHEHMMPVPAADIGTQVMAPNQCVGGSCSTPVVRLCSAIEAILPAASLVALLLMAILVILVVSVLLYAATATVADWRWPPDRRRTLLQVFRC